MRVGDSNSSDVNTSTLFFDVLDAQWPIIYRREYDVRFWGLELLHPFDAHKWGRIANFLIKAGVLKAEMLVRPNEAKKEELLKVHSKRYLNSLKWSFKVAMISEIIGLVIVPNSIVQKRYLKPMRYQVGGTILAGKLALERGYAINLGGGFHHCSATKGGGFCPYADITLLIKNLRQYYNIDKVMIIDLDAHQGNGYARDLIGDQDVYIMDMYNYSIYPSDHLAKKAIRKKIELRSHIEDDEYLQLLRVNFDKALDEFQPKIVIYNAGTDILEGDPFGNLSISPQGIITRDEIVFKKIRHLSIPIVMLTSGGYLPETAFIISESIRNLVKIGLIGPK